MPEPITLFVEGTGAALQAYEHRHEAARKFRKIRWWLKHGRVRIPVFGPGGVGKTTLGRFLTGSLEIGLHTQSYSESFGIEDHQIQSGMYCSLLVAPGQPRRQADTWEGLLRELSGGKSAGVINVVSYGFHSFGVQASGDLSYKQTGYYAPGQSVSDFVAAYTENRRQEELKVLGTLVPHLELARTPFWMLTVIAKQDLWWPHRQQVRAHYLDGPYNELIEKLYEKHGHGGFRHEYLSVSPVISNFLSGSNELLLPNAAGYDQHLQVANQRRVVDLVVQLVSEVRRK